MAEPAAVVPVYAGFVGHKGNGGGLLGADLHTHTMVHQHEAVRHVLDHVDVGDHHGHFIALLDLELVNPECRRHGGHVDAHLVTVTDNLVVGFQGDASLFRHLDGFGEVRIVPLPDLLGTDLITTGQDTVVGLGLGGAVVHQHHFIAGDVDQLVVLRMQGPGG